MGSEAVPGDWEVVLGRDLAAGLIPRGQLRRMQRPVDPAMLPAGAAEALARGIGRHELEDLLLVPAFVRPTGPPWRRRCRYAPLCVLGLGERGVGLWTGAPEPPDLRIVLPYRDITAIERRAGGRWRRLTVTGTGGGITVRYTADGDASADIWTGRLRRRCGMSEAG